MTRVMMLDALKEFLQEKTNHLLLPVSVQRNDTRNEDRAPEVYKMRLPDSSAAKKVAPYILVQFITGRDVQTEGNWSESTAQVRFVFVVYGADEQEGSMHLMNLMETVRIALLKQVVIGNSFKLDTDTGLETLVYPEDTAPYYAGEMMATFFLPPIPREVRLI